MNLMNIKPITNKNMNYKNNKFKEGVVPATMEQINSIDFKKLDKMAKDAFEDMEKINIYKMNKEAEDYIYKRYPINFLLDRSTIQEMANDNIGWSLREKEIMSFRDYFIDNFPGHWWSEVSDILVEWFELISKQDKSNQEMYNKK